MRFTCVIFDLFGTLVFPPERTKLQEALQENKLVDNEAELAWILAGFPLAALILEMGISPLTANQLLLRNTSKNLEGIIELLQQAHPELGEPKKTSLEKSQIVCQLYCSLCTRANNALEVLAETRQKGCKLGLLSNLTHPFIPLIEQLELKDCFDYLSISAETGLLKPEPEAFKLTLDKLHEVPASSVMVGDSLVSDVLGALSAGLYAIHIETSMKQDLVQKSNYLQVRELMTLLDFLTQEI